jgi:RNA polymerase sigma factor (sigma-70 family)
MQGHTLADAVPGERVNDRADRIGALFDAHHDRLYKLSRRLSANADDALDLVQETFLRAARASVIPDGATHEEAWLVRILVNVRRDDWRRAAARRRHDAVVDLRTRPASDPETQAIARTAVWGALDALHPRRRAVVVLHELEGMSTAAVAALLGMSAVTVRWHLSRGRRELTRILSPSTGGTP